MLRDRRRATSTTLVRSDSACAYLLSGYQGLVHGAIPPLTRSEIAQAGDRIVQLYQDWGKPEQAAEWRTKLKPRGGAGRLQQ